jgi:predicted alpha/beta hydrolase family esterase
MTTAAPPTIIILPGLYNSGAGHWQTLWEASFSNAVRIQQNNWNEPNRTDWVTTLDAAIANTNGSIILAAHSLGCATTVWWATRRHEHNPHAAKVKGALLVAPPDIEQANFPAFATGFAPLPLSPLPFNSIVVASSDDPWCLSLVRVQSWAAAWGAEFHDIGPRGHINGDSGLGDWPQGRQWLASLMQDERPAVQAVQGTRTGFVFDSQDD